MEQQDPAPRNHGLKRCSELGHFRDAQFSDGVIRPEAEMPIPDNQVLQFASVFFTGGVVAKLPRVIGELKKHSQNLLLLGLGKTNQHGGRPTGEHWVVTGHGLGVAQLFRQDF